MLTPALALDFWADLQVGQTPFFLGIWNYVLLAFLVAVEGPIATLLGAAAASAGVMNPVLVFIAAAIGNLTSDSLWYSLGYVGKTGWLVRHGQWFGLRERHVQRLEQGMHTHARKILIVAKLTLSLTIPALVAAGMARVPWRRWFPAVFAAEMAWTGGLVLAGFYFTESMKRLEQGLQYLAIAGTISFVVGIVIWLLRHNLRQAVVRLANGNDDKTEERDSGAATS
jgi:membrane protein DedA with SNARE-associated domain